VDIAESLRIFGRKTSWEVTSCVIEGLMV